MRKNVVWHGRKNWCREKIVTWISDIDYYSFAYWLTTMVFCTYLAGFLYINFSRVDCQLSSNLPIKYYKWCFWAKNRIHEINITQWITFLWINNFVVLLWLKLKYSVWIGNVYMQVNDWWYSTKELDNSLFTWKMFFNSNLQWS